MLFAVKQLCELYRLDAEGIVLQWVAYSQSHQGCPINLENLDHLEREVILSYQLCYFSGKIFYLKVAIIKKKHFFLIVPV